MGWRDEDKEWRRQINEEVHSLYCSPNVVRVIKSIRLRWTGYVIRVEECKRRFKGVILGCESRIGSFKNLKPQINCPLRKI